MMAGQAPKIREAQPGDADSLARLSTQLGYPATPAETKRRAEAIVGQPGHALLVAEVDGRVVGWIHVVECVRMESDPSAEVAGLVVDEAFRGSGIGARLLAEAEGWAAAGGYELLRVRSNAERNRARRFYEREGYEVTKSQRNFVKPLRSA